MVAAREEDYPAISDDLLNGRLNLERSESLADATFRNPGATPDMRGVEANTNRDAGDDIPAPETSGFNLGEIPGLSDDASGDTHGGSAGGVCEVPW